MMNMIEPKKIIEEIRRERFVIGLNTENLPSDIKAALEDKKEILESASELAKEIHTKKPHFIFELIQNAEDNEYEDRTPTIRFIIDSGRLIIQNNEKGFEEKNVWALCGIGPRKGSTKGNKSLGYIGEKGIGFKSVFMVANKVQIYSNGFQFGLNHDKANPLKMIIPEWINEIPDFVDPTQTNIVLYFKPEIKNEISKYIEEIHPSLLLFLKKLKVIEIEEKDENKVKRMERYEKNGIVEVIYNERKSYWKVIKKSFEVPQEIDEERRRNVNETETILAFPLKEDYSPDTSNEQFVFAHLPVRKYGFKFIIQADFLLPITREDIIKDNKWNEWLRDSIIEVFLEAVTEFKNDENLKYGFYNYLPLEEIKDDFFLPVVEQIYEKLKKEACILTKTNNWKRPSEVLIGDDEIKEIVTNEDLQKFFGKEYLSDKIKVKKQVLQKLGLNDFSINGLIKCLENKEWIKNQNEKWFVKLFNYLSKKKLSDEQLERLKDLDIIKLENGELTSINKGAVFFPLERKAVYGFEDELRIIKKDIIDIVSEQKKGEKDKILEFLKRLGLKQAHPYEIIENHILPVYESENWKQKDSRTLLGYIRYIKDNIDKYERESDKRLNANKASWETKEDPLKRLKKSLLIRINKDDEGKERHDYPENVYLPKSYGNENDLETLFEGIDVSFVHLCYLEQDMKRIDNEISELKNKLKGKSKKWKRKHRKEVRKIEGQIEKLKNKKSEKVAEWKKFFLKLGMWETIMVKGDPDTEIYQGPDYANNEVTKKLIYKSDKDKTIWKNENWRDTDWKYYIGNDWLSPDFQRALERIESNDAENKMKIAKSLFNLLQKHWNFYKRFMDCHYYYRYYGQVGWSKDSTKSTFYLNLLNSRWLPTTQNALAKPSEVFLDKPEIREVLGDTVPYLAVKIENEDFIETLGINTQANVKNVLNYLKALIERKSEDKKEFEKLYKFLDKYFEEDSERIKEEFTNSPLIFVPDTDNKYYRENEVLWKDVSNIFGKNRVYLEKHYPKLKKLFLEKLGISEKPIPKDYADVLCFISEKSKISNEDKKIIIRIYEELNRNLNPDKVENPISEEDWWNDFIKKSIFLTNKGDFQSNDGDIFINDNNELCELFKDEKDISFLWLPDGYHPDKIKFFIKACSIRYLSESVKIEPLVEGATHLKKDEEHTQRIQTIIPYVLRYLYWKENAEYEKLKKNGTLEKILAIEIYVTDNLRVRYLINEWTEISREAERKCVYHKDKNCIYMKSNGSIYDIAVEFSKVFGEIKGLDDFVMNMMSNVSNAENIMRVKKIEPLPEAEEEILKRVSKKVEKEKGEAGVVKEETKEVESRIGAEEKGKIKVSKKAKAEGIKEHAETSKPESRKKEEMERDISTIIQVKKEWTPEIPPEKAPIKIEEYTPEGEKEMGISEKEVSDKKSVTGPRSTYKDWARPSEGLSEEAKKAIGRWGEKYAVYAIMKEKIEEYFNIKVANNTFEDMPKDYNNVIEETNEGYKLEKDGNVIVEVIWLNKNGESRQYYDIKITKNGDEIFIEVKSTKEYEKAWFQVSKDQWRLMKEKEDKFYIYRVYGAGTKNAKIKKIPNPANLWKEGHIDAYPIGIEI